MGAFGEIDAQVRCPVSRGATNSPMPVNADFFTQYPPVKTFSPVHSQRANRVVGGSPPVTQLFNLFDVILGSSHAVTGDVLDLRQVAS